MQTDAGHKVNLVCARKICLNCINSIECVLECGNFSWKTNNEICEWLFAKNNANFIAIAHNMKSYDGYFILNYIVQNILPGEKLPEVLLTGSKILEIRFSKVIIKDSINFIPMGLAKFTKTFDLHELKKGYFRPENQDCVGCYPDIHFFSADSMSEKDREKFIIWHKNHKNELFKIELL